MVAFGRFQKRWAKKDPGIKGSNAGVQARSIVGTNHPLREDSGRYCRLWVGEDNWGKVPESREIYAGLRQRLPTKVPTISICLYMFFCWSSS
jgi:hypothetical protein